MVIGYHSGDDRRTCAKQNADTGTDTAGTARVAKIEARETSKEASMSNVLAVYEALDAAYAKKTLKLLQSRHSQVYLALFRSLFPDTSSGMVAEELWSRIDECLADLSEAGYADLLPMEGGKPKSGRAVCRDLIDRYNWVESKVLEDGQVEYRLTSDAIEALDTVDRLRTSEALMTSSRMRTILEQIDHAYIRLSPDYEEGLRVLQERVASALDELDRYTAAGGSAPPSEQDAQDEIANLINLMSGIPTDLRRLEEGIRANAMTLIGQFRDDDRPTGEIIGDYIRAGRHLLSETDHGRSFQDSVAVIGDQQLADDVDRKLDSIAQVATSKSQAWERARRIQDSWDQMISGIGWVNRENDRSSHTISRSIRRHDVARDRELTRILKELEARTYAWASKVTARTEGPIVTTVGQLDVVALRNQPYVPGTTTPPPPVESEATAGEPLSMEELRRIGGPLTGELLDAIAAELPLGTTRVDLAACFAKLPVAMRRPVELAGLIQLATTLGMDTRGIERIGYPCVGLDGKTVVWDGPRIILSTAQLDATRGGGET